MQFTVDIEEIRERGLDLRRDLPVSFLADVLKETRVPDAEEVFRAEESGSLVAHLERVGTRVLVKGDIGLTVICACKRCLTTVTLPLAVPFEINLVRPGRAEDLDDDEADDGEEEFKGSFDMGEVDTEPFDGHRIELDPLLREQILLALPMDVACKPECRGLCPSCGADLNLAECGCERKLTDPRWSALKDIKLPN